MMKCAKTVTCFVSSHVHGSKNDGAESEIFCPRRSLSIAALDFVVEFSPVCSTVSTAA